MVKPDTLLPAKGKKKMRGGEKTSSAFVSHRLNWKCLTLEITRKCSRTVLQFFISVGSFSSRFLCTSKQELVFLLLFSSFTFPGINIS